MTQMLPSLPLELSASIFATAALRAGAASSFVTGDTFAVVRPASEGAGTILPAEDLRTVLIDDFGEAAVARFLDALKSGRFHDHRYDLTDGAYRTEAGAGASFVLTREKAIALQNPLAPGFMESSAPTRLPVPLTRAGVYLENLPRIGRDVFEEAVFRALGRQRPEQGDLLWLHADKGEVVGSSVTSAVTVSYAPPPHASAGDYKTTPNRFPLVPLERTETAWEIIPRYVLGAAALRDRVLSCMAGTPWPILLRAKTIPTRAPRKPAAPNPPAVAAPAEPVRPVDLSVVADVFTWPDRDVIYRNRPGIVGITQVEIAVAELALIPKIYFDRAVRWCLGNKDPREGERILFTAGRGFAKKGRIQDCLFVAPAVPPSRSSDPYPRVWMEYRAGRWTILKGASTGAGHRDLSDAVADMTDWNVVREE